MEKNNELNRIDNSVQFNSIQIIGWKIRKFDFEKSIFFLKPNIYFFQFNKKEK